MLSMIDDEGTAWTTRSTFTPEPRRKAGVSITAGLETSIMAMIGQTEAK